MTIKSNDYYTYPSEKEILTAVKACCGRCCVACETPVEYAWRKRETDTADILRIALERELSDKEKAVIYDFYFNNLNGEEIAKKQNLSRSTVNETKKRAELKLKNAVYYLKIYLNDYLYSSEDDIVLDYSLKILRARENPEASIGSKIKNLRVSHALPVKTAEKSLGMARDRLLRLEDGSVLPDSEEIKKICLFYGITYNKLLGELK